MRTVVVFTAVLIFSGLAIAQDKPASSDVPPAQAVSPEGSSVFRIGGGVKPPRAIYSPDPEYPRKAHKPRHQDTVVLRLIVGSDGLPHDMKVTRSLSPEFDEEAMDSVKKWKFDPATKDGKPVSVLINVEIIFKH
jgi:TonB family protein